MCVQPEGSGDAITACATASRSVLSWLMTCASEAKSTTPMAAFAGESSVQCADQPVRKGGWVRA